MSKEDAAVDTPLPTMHVPTSGAVDMSALREISDSDFKDEYGGEGGIKAPSTEKPKGKSKESDDVTEDDSDEDEDIFDPDELDDEDDEEEEELDDEDEDDEEEEDDDSSGEEVGDEDEEDEEVDSKNFVYAKDAEGNELKIARDSLIEVIVDGEPVEMTIQEAINKASAETYGARELSQLGRDKAKLRRDKDSFEAEKEEYQEQSEFLYELATNGDPEDYVQYVGMLQGRDPDQVLADLVKNALTYAQKFGNMTQEEIARYNSDKKQKFQDFLKNKKTERSQKKTERDVEIQQIQQALEAEGLTHEDWLQAGEELRDLIEAGQLEQVPTGLDIVDHAILRKHEGRIREAIHKLNPALSQDGKLFERISVGIWREEHLKQKRFTDQQVAKYVRKAAGYDPKRLGKSLSKKAKRTEKTSKRSAKSKSANSRKRKKEQKEESGATTLKEHWDRLYGRE